MDAGQILGQIEQKIKKEFDANRRILSFDEYLFLVRENPKNQIRGSAQYIADMMDHYGKTQTRFKLFDLPVDGIAPKIVGHEQIQSQIYRVLRNFSRQGMNNKLILLHGPNGSAKSSIIHALMGGIEQYSKEAEGASYTFNWIFPVERYTKGGIGLNTYPTNKETPQNFSKLPDEEVAAKIPCDLKDHPLLLVPAHQRKEFLENFIGKEAVAAIWDSVPHYLTRGDLCHRCKQIFDALLIANNGDYRKVLMHIQVERIYHSRRYRKSLVTIEPQMHVDANYNLLSYNKSISSIPASLQSLNLFTLTGDLIDGNRGMVEFSDLLKRPVDAFKYLLSACESGSVNIGSSIAYTDCVFFGATNEIQLDAFKEFPDFISFKARIELIRAPYLLSATQEQEIYTPQLEQIASGKHIAPHVSWTAALWAVLTRLKKPNNINYPPNISTLISNLSPLEKAKLYDTGEMPAQFSPEDRKLIKGNITKLKEEYNNVPYYEGRMGASAREIKSILFEASQNVEYPCLSPNAVLRSIEEFTKRVSEYEFLKQDVKDGYHDSVEFIKTVRNEYLNKIDREVRDSIGLYDSGQWEEFLKKYIQQISLLLKKEKSRNPITGKHEDPDTALIDEFEKIVGAPTEAAEKEPFRQNNISQIGVWSLDHPKEPVIYAKVFPEFWKKLEKHYFESQKALLSKMSDALLVYDSQKDDPTSEGAQLARKTIQNMKSKLGYCEKCAKEVIMFLLRQRY